MDRLVRIEGKNRGIYKIPFLPYKTPVSKIKVPTALLTKIIMDDRFVITEVSEDGLSEVRLTPINVGKKQVKERVNIVSRRAKDAKIPKVPKVALTVRPVSREDVLKQQTAKRAGTEVPLGIDFR